MKYWNCVLCGLFLPATVSASLVFQGPMMFGGGTSSLPNILTIQNTGTASGCVGFLAGQDVTGLAACPAGFTGAGGNEQGTAAQTGTRTIAQVNAAGIGSASNLLFVLQTGEPNGLPIDIQDLAITFFDPAQDLSFTATLPGTPLHLANTAAGSAPNSGFAFRLDPLQATFAADFFGNANNRIGGAATLSGSAGGTARVFLAPTSGVGAAVPEPASIGELLSGLVLLAMVSARQLRPKNG